MSDRLPIAEYEWSAKIDASQYWQGAGVSGTKWDFCETGIGGTAQEAFDDALETLAMHDYDATTIEVETKDLPEGNAHDDCECECEGYCESDCCNPEEFDPGSHCTSALSCDCSCHDECEMHWFVTIYVKDGELGEDG